MRVPEMWPFTGEVTPSRHRVVHIWSTRWRRDDGNIDWAAAQQLRRLSKAGSDSSFADASIFQGQLKRQYERVSDRMPHLAGSEEPVELAHESSGDETVWMNGHCFLARMPSGHLLACANVLYEGPLRELPSLLVAALEAGPDCPVRRGASTERLETVLNELPWARDLRQRAQAELGWEGALDLRLGSEMHSMVFAWDGDDSLFTPAGEPDSELVTRLVSRLLNDTASAPDTTIKWPSEWNKLERAAGAIRPGASFVTGAHRHASGNALISALLQMAAASLLREARDEMYAVQQKANAEIESDKLSFDWRGRGPLGDELNRLAHVEIAVAFDIESHLDMRRIISDAMLVQWHGCFAEALDTPRSVAALHETAAHLVQGMQTVTVRSASRNAFVVGALAAILTAAALIVSVILEL